MNDEIAVIEVIARGACVVDGHLLICRGLRQSNLYLPGGHVEFGETSRSALEREIREETGLQSQAGALLGVCESTFVQDGRLHAEISLVLTLTMATCSPSNIVNAREDWIRFEWIALETLSQIPLLPVGLRNHLVQWLDAPSRTERLVQG